MAESLSDHIQTTIQNSPPMIPAERFCPVSLGDWIALCAKADVPAVPAFLAGIFERDDILKFDQQGPHRDRLDTVYRTLGLYKLPVGYRHLDHMMRFDCCANLEIKHQLAEGHPEWRPEFNTIVLDDPRAYDIIADYPRVTVPVWSRPWLKAMLFDGYPVEYRAFVRDGEIAGVSSYYPQRPLPEFQEQIETVLVYTHRLRQAVKPPFQWPRGMPLLPPPIGAGRHNDLDRQGVHFTADYLVTEAGQVLFLEGGPPAPLLFPSWRD